MHRSKNISPRNHESTLLMSGPKLEMAGDMQPCYLSLLYRAQDNRGYVATFMLRTTETPRWHRL